LEKLWEVVKSVVTSLPSLFVLLGAIFIAAAALGSVTLGSNSFALDSLGRGGLGLAGVFFVALAFVQPRDANLSDAAAKALSVKIIYPVQDAQFGRGTVRGTIAKRIPKGYELHLLRGYAKGGFVPNTKVLVNAAAGQWSAPDFDVGGARGETRILQAWIVGRDGAKLLRCFSECHAIQQKQGKAEEHRSG